MFDSKLITLIVSVITIAPIIAILIEKWKFKNNTNINRDKNYYYKCIFITYENYSCLQHVYNTTSCGEKCSYAYLTEILNLLKSAKSSISMCMYHLSLQQIFQEIINAKLRGVSIRIITDREMEFNSGSKISRLRQEGVEIKTQSIAELTGYLHHKFCLIDKNYDSQIMWFGSLNLTLQGICSNWDNIVITNNNDIILRFSNAFENLWTDM
ncbi:mitochondrial cardiolipin hydrolase [Onthophagus taurus]|uniref:mitochondrial cardiolipin hydrolase n=1 Tax=Onthophagus taurus TaxID=166361 RepID=UPI0039BDC0EF